MRNVFLFNLILICGILLSAPANAFSSHYSGEAKAAMAPSCPCDEGYVQIELLYLGEGPALVEIFNDADLAPGHLMFTFEGVASGASLTLNAADADNLSASTFTNRTYVRVSVGEEAASTDFYSTCPSVGFPEPLEEHIIIGKAFGDFTVTSHTDNAGSVCSIDDSDAGLNWQVGGNVVEAPNNRLGSINNEDIAFMTNNEVRGVITNEGHFGVHTTTPAATLDVNGTFNVSGNTTLTGSDNDGTNAALNIRSGSQSMLLDGNEIDVMEQTLYLNYNSEQNVNLVRGGGNVSVGDVSVPDARLNVAGDIRIQNKNNIFDLAVDEGGDLNFIGDDNTTFMEIDDANGDVSIRDVDGNNVISMITRDIPGQIGGCISLRGSSPLTSTINIDANWAGSGRGRIQTDEIQIMGGSDISENFEVAEHEAAPDVQAGMLVSIDSDTPGQLEVSHKAKDKKVVGVVSGANGVNTGLFMGQKGSVADGEYPIALMGRVYVLADASYGKIEPGDLLTSSPVPGHAMKVRKARKAQGAIVGKAMSALEEGQGYVLVLISLQ